MIEFKYKNKIRKAKIVSFDIFDTLLLRPFLTPQDVFCFIAQAYNEPDFPKYRISAEQTLRETKNIEYATYDDIYSILPSKFGYLKDKEQELENQTLYANPKIKAIYDYAKKLKKRIIITTDMYYSPDFLASILNKNGYDSFEKIYVSGHIKKAKYNGSLFEYIKNDLNAKPEDILHIGDNKFSDYEMPKQAGLRALVVKPAIKVFLKKNPQFKKFIQNHQGNLTAGIVIGLAIKTMLIKQKTPNYWSSWGYFWGGPFCYALSKFIVDEMKKDGRNELICVARDGYTIEKIVNEIEPSIMTHYIYASRTINLLTSLEYTNELPWTSKAKSIVSLFKDQSLDFKKACKNKPTTTKEDCIKIIEDNLSLLQPLSQNIYNEYLNYLKQFQVKNKRIALFDITAGAYNSLKLLTRSFPDKDILGLYWFALENKNFNYRQYSDASKYRVSNYEILELLVTAPELPLKTFNTKGEFIRIDNKYEKVRQQKYKYISEGELIWTQNYLKTYSKAIGFNPIVLIDFINVFCDGYTFRDYLKFRCIYHGYDEAHTKYKHLIHFNKFKPKIKSILQKIFSVKNIRKNNRKIKQITVLGIKIKIGIYH